MAYKSFKGKRKWQVFGDKPIISILSTGLICFNKVCYETFVKPTGYQYVTLYYDPEAKKIAFELCTGKKPGDFVLPITLAKTGLIAIVKAKTFLNHLGIKYEGQSRSYPVHQTTLYESGPGYQRTWSEVKRINLIEIRLDEYITDEK